MSAAMTALCSAASSPSGMVGGGSLALRPGPTARPGSRSESSSAFRGSCAARPAGCVDRHGGEGAEDKREHGSPSLDGVEGLVGRGVAGEWC